MNLLIMFCFFILYHITLHYFTWYDIMLYYIMFSSCILGSKVLYILLLAYVYTIYYTIYFATALVCSIVDFS